MTEKIEISRRWFLIGSAAAVATAAIKIPLAEKLISPSYLRREIREICICVDPDGKTPVFISMEVGWDKPFNIALGPGSMYRWLPARLDEDVWKEWEGIIIKENETVKISATGALADIRLICNDTKPDGRVVPILETHRFTAQGLLPAEVLYFNAEDVPA